MIKNKNFALIGASGYIAPRHMKSIKDTNNNLLVAYDPFDSVGILDSYFPNAHFFTEFERFDRHISKMLYKKQNIDYFSICSPNYLHDSHIRYSLRMGSNAICEKPLVINPWNLDTLESILEKSQGKIYCILQMRLHKNAITLKKSIIDKKISSSVNLEYITSRGNWYKNSWKGDINKSGGVLMNIGIHFFDLLIWVFGKVNGYEVKYRDSDKVEGKLFLKNASINWKLSINYDDLPKQIKMKGLRTYRSLTIDGDDFEFSDGFTELHTDSYKEIVKGKGFTVNDVRPSIELVYKLRTCALNKYHENII